MMAGSPLQGTVVGQWVASAANARAVYDLIAAIVADDASIADANVRRAARVSNAVWEHVLKLEGCAAWLEQKSRGARAIADQLAPAADYLRAESGRSLRNAVAMVQQLAEIAPIAAELGVKVLVLKGGGRLLGGEAAGARTMADIDLLVADGGGPLFHSALQSRLGYRPEEPGTPSRHLPSLVRSGSLPIEVHLRLSDAGSLLDRRVWSGSRSVMLGSATVDIPSATALMLHAVEHAVVVHRAVRYRLRDVTDVATAWTESVDVEELRDFIGGDPHHVAMQTLVIAAARLTPSAAARKPSWLSGSRPDGRAWRRIRRVGRARLWAPPRPGVPPTSDPRVMVLSQMAEGSPGPLLRLGTRALGAPRRAWQLASGDWLPAEVLAARDASRAPAQPATTAAEPPAHGVPPG